MAVNQAQAIISPAVNGGPFMYTFTTDGAMQNAATGVASINAAVQAIQPLIAAIGQSPTRVVITVNF